MLLDSHGWWSEEIPRVSCVVDRMLKLARVTEQAVVYDLGSGDGRIVIAAAKRYGARGVGIENRGAHRSTSRLSLVSPLQPQSRLP